MKIISKIAILLAVIDGIIGCISRLKLVPIMSMTPKAWAGEAAVLLLLAIAINTLKKD